MDLKDLLTKLDLIEGSMKRAEQHPTGPKFTGYWKGKDPRTPGTKMVGGSEEYDESMLKDLQRGPRAKTRAEELAEEYQAFLQALEEENLGVNPKRPSRKGSRPSRGHEPQPRYKYHDEKVDEYGANNPQQGMQNATVGQNDPKQAMATAQATQTLKAATQSTAPTTNIAKALDAASQGKSVSTTDMKVLEPLMKDMTTVAQDPKLATQFKTLATQIQQKQQQQQAKK